MTTRHSSIAIRILAAFALIFVFSFGMVAYAAAIQTPATVPFDFEVGGVKMPAGKYVFHSHLPGGVLTVMSPEGNQHAVLGTPIGNPNSFEAPKLVFQYDGVTYRLAEVWLGGGFGGKAIPVEKRPDLSARRKTDTQRIEVALSR